MAVEQAEVERAAVPRAAARRNQQRNERQRRSQRTNEGGGTWNRSGCWHVRPFYTTEHAAGPSGIIRDGDPGTPHATAMRLKPTDRSLNVFLASFSPAPRPWPTTWSCWSNARTTTTALVHKKRTRTPCLHPDPHGPRAATHCFTICSARLTRATPAPAKPKCPTQRVIDGSLHGMIDPSADGASGYSTSTPRTQQSA